MTDACDAATFHADVSFNDAQDRIDNGGIG